VTPSSPSINDIVELGPHRLTKEDFWHGHDLLGYQKQLFIPATFKGNRVLEGQGGKLAEDCKIVSLRHFSRRNSGSQGKGAISQTSAQKLERISASPPGYSERHKFCFSKFGTPKFALLRLNHSQSQIFRLGQRWRCPIEDYEISI